MLFSSNGGLLKMVFAFARRKGEHVGRLRAPKSYENISLDGERYLIHKRVSIANSGDATHSGLGNRQDRTSWTRKN